MAVVGQVNECAKEARAGAACPHFTFIRHALSPAGQVVLLAAIVVAAVVVVVVVALVAVGAGRTAAIASHALRGHLVASAARGRTALTGGRAVLLALTAHMGMEERGVRKMAA